MLGPIRGLAQRWPGRLGLLTAVALAPIAIIIVYVSVNRAPLFGERDWFFMSLVLYATICCAVSLPPLALGRVFAKFERRDVGRALVLYGQTVVIGCAAVAMALLLINVFISLARSLFGGS